MGAKDQDHPITLEIYEYMAEKWATRVETQPYIAYLDKPTLFSLLLNVKDKNVLDAGCGTGVYSD